jgi:hypothetical protein
MKPENKIELGAMVQWTVSEYADCVVARCDPLGLTAYADTLDELPDIIEETLDDLFRNLIQEGILDEFLQKRGWTKRPSVKLPQMLESDTPLRVPWEIIQQAKSNRHVPC